jgi:hypothetical protein
MSMENHVGMILKREKQKNTKKTPNVVVKWLTLLLRNWEVQGSHLSPETDYPGLGFSWFPSVASSECRESTLKLGHSHFLPNLLVHHSLYSLLSDAWDV